MYTRVWECMSEWLFSCMISTDDPSLLHSDHIFDIIIIYEWSGWVNPINESNDIAKKQPRFFLSAFEKNDTIREIETFWVSEYKKQKYQFRRNEL